MATTLDAAYAALPSDWNGYGSAQKIDYYNANNITSDLLTSAGVSEADLGWMAQNGYTAGSAQVAAPTAPAPAPADNAWQNDFAKMMYSGDVNHAQATMRGLLYSQEQNWTPEQTATQWNTAFGTNYTAADYTPATQRHGVFDAGAAVPAGAVATPEQAAAIKAAYGASQATQLSPSVLQYAKAQGWSRDQALAAVNQTMGSSLGANDFAFSTSNNGFNWQEPKPVLPSTAAPQQHYQANLNRGIDAASETIEGRMGNLLQTDANGNYTNQVVRQAVDRSMQQMAGRGLLNSSMASQAAQEAAIAKAIEIVGPDAERYFQQGRANQDAQNVFARDEQTYKYDLGKLGAQSGYDMEKLKLQLTQSGSQFNQELAFKYDSLKLGDESRNEAESRAHQNALEIKNIDAVNSAYDLYLRRLTDIDSNKDYDAATKTTMKNAAGKDFDLYAKAKGIAWQMNLSERFSMNDVAPDDKDLWKNLASGNPNGGGYEAGGA